MLKEYKVRVTGTYNEVITVHAETPESAKIKAEGYYDGPEDGISIDQLDNVETEIISVDENYKEPSIDPLAKMILQYASDSHNYIVDKIFHDVLNR